MDERGMSSTPKSLSTESSRRLEAKGSSESSFTVSELYASGIPPSVVIGISGSRIKPLSVVEKVKTNSIETPGNPALLSLARSSQESIAETKTVPPKTGNVVFMRPRYSRRVQSKSEPVHKSAESESERCSKPPANGTDITAEQHSVSVQMAQSNSPTPSMIPKLGNRGSPAVRQLPIPPRNSSDGKCGTYLTPRPKGHPERASEGVPSITKDIKDTAGVPATTAAKSENHPPPKTGENQSAMATSRRGGQTIRRQRTGSLRGRRGRVSRGHVATSGQK
ncbi:hypothetical protein GGI35DRAFT_258009 [Trichoderma velutinum]